MQLKPHRVTIQRLRDNMYKVRILRLNETQVREFEEAINIENKGYKVIDIQEVKGNQYTSGGGQNVPNQ